MNLIDIANMQEKLDDRIAKQHNVSMIETFDKRKLALFVEVAELANEVRSFKFWSTKKRSDKEVILEEFSDCFHFCLSLGLSMNIDFSMLTITKTSNNCLNDQFLIIFKVINNLDFNDEQSFFTLFDELIILANSLEIDFEEICDGYVNKNNLNYKRQDEKY